MDPWGGPSNAVTCRYDVHSPTLSLFGRILQSPSERQMMGAAVDPIRASNMSSLAWERAELQLTLVGICMGIRTHALRSKATHHLRG